MINAVIFDVGGVLVKWNSNWVTDEIAKFFGKKKDEILNIYNRLVHIIGRGEIDEKEFWSRFINELGIKVKIKLPKESLLLTGYRKNFEIKNDVFEIVASLKRNKYKVAILSDTNTVHAKFTKKMGVFNGFNPVILSYGVGLRKPDPKIYKVTLGSLKIKPQEAVFIDDIKEHVEGAKRLGINGIVFKNPTQLRKELQSLGVRV